MAKKTDKRAPAKSTKPRGVRSGRKSSAKPTRRRDKRNKTESTYPKPQCDKAAFIAASGLDDALIEASGLEWDELAAIFEDHLSRMRALEDVATMIADSLRRIESVHSVRTRVKSPAHLVQKIVRKRTADKKRQIRFDNYKSEITDLIGVRALHLFKEEWVPIHEFVCGSWEASENPTAYVRKGDHDEWLSRFKDAGCKVENHPRQYRSVHYLIKTAPAKEQLTVEIQVRTIFEEGWSEIDHRINYPTAVPFPMIGFFLGIFNRLAGSADEMGSFIYGLVADMNRREQEASGLADERANALKQVEKLISDLKMSESKRRSLQKALDAATSSDIGLGTVTFKPAESYFGDDVIYSGSISANPNYFASLATTQPSFISAGLYRQRCTTCHREYDEPLNSSIVTTQCPSCRSGMMFLNSGVAL